MSKFQNLFLKAKDVGLWVDLLVELDDGTAWAAEHGAAIFHHRALQHDDDDYDDDDDDYDGDDDDDRDYNPEQVKASPIIILMVNMMILMISPNFGLI